MTRDAASFQRDSTKSDRKTFSFSMTLGEHLKIKPSGGISLFVKHTDIFTALQ